MTIVLDVVRVSFICSHLLIVFILSLLDLSTFINIPPEQHEQGNF